MGRLCKFRVPQEKKRFHLNLLAPPPTAKEIAEAVEFLNENQKGGTSIRDMMVDTFAKKEKILLSDEIVGLKTMLHVAVLQAVSLARLKCGGQVVSGRICGFVYGVPGSGKSLFLDWAGALNGNRFVRLDKSVSVAGLQGGGIGKAQNDAEEGELERRSQGVIAIEDLHGVTPPMTRNAIMGCLSNVMQNGTSSICKAGKRKEMPVDIAIHLDMNRSSDVYGGSRAHDFSGIGLHIFERMSYAIELALTEEQQVKRAELMSKGTSRGFSRQSAEVRRTSADERLWAVVVAVVRDQHREPQFHKSRFPIMCDFEKHFGDRAGQVISHHARFTQIMTRFALASGMLEGRDEVSKEDYLYAFERGCEMVEFLFEFCKEIGVKGEDTSRAKKLGNAIKWIADLLMRDREQTYTRTELLNFAAKSGEDLSPRTIDYALRQMKANRMVDTIGGGKYAKYKHGKVPKKGTEIAHVLSSVSAVDFEDDVKDSDEIRYKFHDVFADE